MAFMKIGYHIGPGGIGVPRSIYEQLDAAGIPYFAKGADAFPFDAQEIAKTSSVPHTVVYRRSVPYDGASPIGNPDVPDYNLDPVTAANNHWAWHKAGLPPELDKSITWIETVNEVDKLRSGWLGQFALETASMTLNEGYKWAAFGWSTGEPEVAHWEEPAMLEFLRLAAANPDRIAIALHEYSLTTTGLMIDFPYLVGRFRFLLDVCDAHGIGWPTILITEFGWTYNSVPDVSFAISDLIKAGEVYSQYPNVKGAGIWYLGGGWNNIANGVSQFFDPLLNATLNPDPVPPPVIDDCTPRVPYSRVYNVIPQDASEGRAVEIFLEGWRRSKETAGGSADDALFGPNLDSVLGRFYDVPQSKHQEYIDWRDANYPGSAIEFAGNTGPLPPTFAFTHWPTEFQVITQPFGADPAYYAQFGLPGHGGVDIRAYSGTRIFAVADGVVSHVETDPNAHNFGIHVRINHIDDYQTTYAHMQTVTVGVGATVSAGDLIGLANNTGNSRGAHLHLQMKRIGYTYVDLGGTQWPFNIFDPTGFLEAIMDSPPGGGDYHGPTVAFVPGVDQPASDWRWPQAKSVFDTTGLSPKFHTQGENHTWWASYRHPDFNLTRILLDPNFSGDIFAETVNNVAQFFNQGARDFEVLNEPNIEGMGIRWNNGTEFGAAFRVLCQQYEAQFPGIRLWFPGMSPGFGAQHQFINDAKAAGAFDFVFGVCQHVYSGTVTNEQFAIDEIISEALDFQQQHALDRPLVISEFSVNRPAPASYKAAVYHGVYDSLALTPGIQAAYSFTSDWHPSPDDNQEGWLDNGIHNAF